MQVLSHPAEVIQNQQRQRKPSSRLHFRISCTRVLKSRLTSRREHMPTELAPSQSC